MRLTQTLVGFLLAVCGVMAEARIVVTKSNDVDKLIDVKIVDQIAHEEDVEFLTVIEELQNAGYKLKLNAIQLNSSGGSPSAAQVIGRIIRDKELNTIVLPSSKCASACIYVLTGGVVRMAYGAVTVHRTTFTDEMPLERLDAGLRSADARTIKHFRDMGISALLTDAVLTTPNWRTREITEVEMRRWGIHASDRLWEGLWFRRMANQTNKKLIAIEEIVVEFHVDCNKEAMQFKMTMWDCLEKRIREK